MSYALAAVHSQPRALAPMPAFTIEGVPPVALVNVPYAYTFTSDGEVPVSWEVVGALPGGMGIDPETGTLEPGVFPDPLLLDGPALVIMLVGLPSSSTYSAGGIAAGAALTWTQVGAMPPGITASTEGTKRIIAGTPT